MTTLDLVASGYRMGKHVVSGMCADLTPEEFHHQPVPGANSAAWIIGHLALTAKRTAERLGASDMPVVSEDFVARYKATRQAAGNQSGLGDKAELLALFDTITEKLMEVVRKLPPESLLAPPPITSPPWVSNIGEMLLFGAMHFTLHGGQISSIRRSLGKPPLV